VVNISYQAAIDYCDWLTTVYNSLEKQKYKKVVFKLPSKREWEWAASGGRDKFYYPWGGPYCKNSKGCYLANFCPLEKQYLYKKDTYSSSYNYPNDDRTISRGVDGAIIPTKVGSYFPNAYGLYNCSGNVAEMVNEFGMTKGGSWNSNDFDMKIGNKEIYQVPSPNIGFRVFMEVIEK